MTKQVLLRALILVSALLVLNGCKDSESAKDAKNGDPALVLDAGQEPRTQLRYKIEHGTTTSSTMDFGIASLATTRAGSELSVTPGVRLHVMSGPTMEGKRGSTRFDVRIIKAEAIVPEGIDPAVAQDLNKSASVLNNVGGWVEVNDRGIIQRTELNQDAKRADVPVRLLVMIINARTSLARVILPAEPVGAGARWEARKDLTLYGFNVSQVDTYTLVETVGDELKLNVQIQQTALPQTVTFEEEGIELSVESFKMNATGEVIANLNALETNAAASGDSVGIINVKTVDGTEKVEIDRAFQVRMTVTYDLARSEAETAAAIANEEEAGEALEAQE
jgi:flavin-binding protein dodecin